LPEETLLSDEFLRQLINVGEVDILIGLPTHNNAGTIQQVTRSIQAGILKCFPRDRAVIINADGGSSDGTPQMVTGVSIDDVWSASKVYALRTLHAISTEYGSSPEPGRALRIILAATDLLQAKVCVIISADESTIEPDWLQRLVKPVYRDNFDLALPIYQRQRFEGVLTRNVLYPMIRSIYGCRIREPFASDFAISSRLATDLLNQDVWDQDWVRAGPEISLTIAAITGSYRICQAFLGVRAHTDPSATDLLLALRRTVGALFASLDANFSLWSKISSSQPVPSIDGRCEITPETFNINRERLRDMFANGVSELDPVFQYILSPQTLAELHKIASLKVDEFRYPPDLWARTIFEFAASFHQSVINRNHIIQALGPLFRGRALSFLLEISDASEEQIEKNVESLCAEFEGLKPYLLEAWKAKR
jgi:glycosyltransferase involved in cell wall biosynthesis